MKKIALMALVISSALAQETNDLKIEGRLESYTIETIKTGTSVADAWSNTLGGELAVSTPKWYDLYSKVNFLTANGYLLPSSVDGSNLSNDLSKQGLGLNSQSFSVLGEAFIAYETADMTLKVGKQKVNTPLANTKLVRILPSTFNGVSMVYKLDDFNFGLASYNSFKQRTSNLYVNVLEHALGINTFAYTGVNKADMVVSHVTYKSGLLEVKAYDYYIDNFLHSLYAQVDKNIDNFKFAFQAISQQSVGTFHTNLTNGLALNGNTYTAGIKTFSSGAKVSYKADKTTYTGAVTNTMHFNNALSDVIAIYDGTPLFTDTITGNNLFKSWYGRGLDRADAGYKAGVFAYQAKVKHGWTEKVSTMLSLTQYRQNAKSVQTDVNAVLAYKLAKWSIKAKGIWVFDNNQVSGDTLTQYRFIVSRPF